MDSNDNGFKKYYETTLPNMLGEIELIMDSIEGFIEDITENNVMMPYANDTMRVDLAARLLANKGGE
jgi:hypothetical protein|tara:strand:- start:89 stop:289 length:201 start_codon:yes stop_codon:yes gene_type:complete